MNRSLTFVFAMCLWMSIGIAGIPLRAELPTVTDLTPWGAPRGTTATIVTRGKFSHWPPKVFCNRAGVEWRASDKQGTWEVAVAADAEPGWCWLRFYDEEGATSWRPFYVGMLPELVEVEPNDRARDAMRIDRSVTIQGKLAKSGDVDTYQVSLRQGETLVASVTAHEWLDSPMDVVLQIGWVREPLPSELPGLPEERSEEVFVLAQDDDERGLDPLIAFQAPRDGTYVARVFAFPSEPNSTVGFAGGDSYIYRLTLATSAYLDYVLPLSASRSGETAFTLHGWNLPNESTVSRVVPDDRSAVNVFLPEAEGSMEVPVFDGEVIAVESVPTGPLPIRLPSSVSGCLMPGHWMHEFTLTAAKGKPIDLQVEAQSLGFPLDAVLRVTDENGKSLAEFDDAGKDRDPRLVWNPPADGTYRVQILDRYEVGGMRYVYRLTAREATPDFLLKVEADRFVATSEKPLEITVNVERIQGFDKDIAIQVEGLPEGVTAEPVVSGKSGAASKQVKLSLVVDKSTAKPWNGSVRVVAENPRRVAVSTSAPAGAPRESLWLTVRP